MCGKTVLLAVGEFNGRFLCGAIVFQCRVGPARFERRPTIGKCRENMVGRRGEAPLVPPYDDWPCFTLALAPCKSGPFPLLHLRLVGNMPAVHWWPELGMGWFG